MKKFLQRISVFLLVYIIIVQLYKVVVPQPYWQVDPILDIKYNDFVEHISSYNSLVIGSSRVYRHFVPAVFDEHTNLATTSFNFGIPATSNPESYFIAEKLLDEENLSLKTLYLEITPFATVQTQNLGKTKTYYWMNKDYIQFNAANIANPSWSYEKKLYSAYTMGVGLFAQLLNPSISKSITLKNYDTIAASMQDGYLSIEQEIENGDTSLLARKEKLLNNSSILEGKAATSIKNFEKGVKDYNVEAHLAKLHDIQQKCKSKNIELVGIILPRYPNYKEVINIQQKVTDLKIIEMADASKYPQLYEVQYSADNGHLNEAGAHLFSKIMADQVNQSIK
ncbi:MAG: hypothetical protein AAF573_14245 [Bacteroidota bacterium]